MIARRLSCDCTRSEALSLFTIRSVYSSASDLFLLPPSDQSGYQDGPVQKVLQALRLADGLWYHLMCSGQWNGTLWTMWICDCQRTCYDVISVLRSVEWGSVDYVDL